MNRKGVVESNEKQDAIMKDNPVKNIHLPYKWFSQSRFSLSKMEVVEAQRKRYRGYQILGAKILSEKKKKKGSARKTFCQSCRSNQCAGSLIGYVTVYFTLFSLCFLK